MSKLFSCNYLTICRNVARWDAREESNHQKDDGFWLLWGIFNEYSKQNIIEAELRKANFHSADICRCHLKKDQGEKLIHTLIFFKLPRCSWGF